MTENALPSQKEIFKHAADILQNTLDYQAHYIPDYSGRFRYGRTQPAIASDACGMLGVFAEFETNLRRERPAEGIVASKRRGAYRGRPPRIDMETIKHRLAKGRSPTELARELGISRGTVYKTRASMTELA